MSADGSIRSGRRGRRVAVLAVLVVASGAALTTAPAIAASHAASTPTCGGEVPVTADGTKWLCTFDDEFGAATGDPDALDRTKWVPQVTATSGYVTGPVTSLACYIDSPSTIAVSGGSLNLTVRQLPNSSDCGFPGLSLLTPYAAGSVSTSKLFSQTYGRYEVRAKLPTTKVQGLQETLWLWPDNATKYGAYPASGEIDFSEFYSQFPQLDVPYLHYNANGPLSSTIADSGNQVTAYNCAINYGKFNTYSAQWEPGEITVDVNGARCLDDKYTASGLGSAAPFDQPFFVDLTQALGIGTNSFLPGVTPLPATTSIDYVRVWKADGTSSGPAINPTGVPSRATNATSRSSREVRRFDDRSHRLHWSGGWRRVRVGRAWRHTEHRSRGAGATMRTRVHGGHLKLIGARAPTGARFAVRVDGGRRSIVSTHAARRSVRQVLWRSRRLSAGRHRIEVRVLHAGHGRAVSIDSLVAGP